MPSEWVKGYASRRSDWSESECDYATNAIVHNFYHPPAKWYRTGKFEQFYKTPIGNFPKEVLDRVFKGDTVRIGFDYYSLTGVSKDIVPHAVLGKDFSSGQVYVYRLFKTDTGVILEGL